MLHTIATRRKIRFIGRDYVSGQRVITVEAEENGASAGRCPIPIETTGRELRSLFSWISDASSDDYVDGSVAR